MARFVKFPGVAGSYVSTDDVNLLDADTAHIEQSIGGWVGSGLIAVDSSPPPGQPYGSKAIKSSRVSGTGNYQNITRTGLNGVPVSPSTQYAVSCSVYLGEPGAGRIVFIQTEEYDAAGSPVMSSSPGQSPDLPSSWITVAGTVTTQPNTAFIAIQLNVRDMPDTADLWSSSFLLSEGADLSFVPSLRIVGAVQVDVQADALWTSLGSDITVVGAGVAYADLRLMIQRRVGGNWLFQRQDATGVFGPSFAAQVVADGLHNFVFLHDPSVPDWTVDVDSAGPVSIGVDVGTPVLGIEQSLQVGQQGTTDPFAGNIFTVTERDGAGGPVVAEFDAADIGL